MSSATLQALESMPAVFTTAQYRDAADVATNSASRTLRVFTELHLVSKLRRGTWRNFTVDAPDAEELLIEPRTAHGIWNPALELTLQTVFGDTPRRISGQAALLAAGVPLVCAVEITVGDDITGGDGLGGVLHRENNATLLSHSEQITTNTWVSNSQRAVVEVAQSGMYPRWDERLGWMIVNQFDVCTPTEVHAVADDLNYRAGLRRLSSLTQALTESEVGRSHDFDPHPGWVSLAETTQRGDKPIKLTPWLRSVGEHLWTDTARKVLWHTTADGLAKEILT